MGFVLSSISAGFLFVFSTAFYFVLLQTQLVVLESKHAYLTNHFNALFSQVLFLIITNWNEVPQALCLFAWSRFWLFALCSFDYYKRWHHCQWTNVFNSPYPIGCTTDAQVTMYSWHTPVRHGWATPQQIFGQVHIMHHESHWLLLHWNKGVFL